MFEELENLREDLLVLEKLCSNNTEAISHPFSQKHLY